MDPAFWFCMVRIKQFEVDQATHWVGVDEDAVFDAYTYFTIYRLSLSLVKVAKNSTIDTMLPKSHRPQDA